jgi:hypothetical protein
MAVDRTGDDRPAPERPQRSGGRPKERLSCLARNGRFSAQGKKTSRPLRMPIEPSIARRSLVRHAPSRPQWVSQLTGRTKYGNGIIGADRLEKVCPARQHAKLTNTGLDPSLRRTCEGLAPSCFSPRCRFAAPQTFDCMAASSQHARAADHAEPSTRFQCDG